MPISASVSTPRNEVPARTQPRKPDPKLPTSPVGATMDDKLGFAFSSVTKVRKDRRLLEICAISLPWQASLELAARVQLVSLPNNPGEGVGFVRHF